MYIYKKRKYHSFIPLSLPSLSPYATLRSPTSPN